MNENNNLQNNEIESKGLKLLKSILNYFSILILLILTTVNYIDEFQMELVT